MLSGCDMPTAPPDYIVGYAAEGTREGMSITVSTPIGTEQHKVGANFASPLYTFHSGEHAYISAQNQGAGGKVTVRLVYRRTGLKPVKLETTSTGGASIATVSWLVGDETPRSGAFP